jgi:hypothetical protein
MDKGTREALKDAEYALRRFDEVTARIDFDRWHASGTAVGHAQEVLKTIRTMYIGEAEGVLTKLGDGGKPTTTDLLLVMYDVQMGATELDSLSNDAFSWGSESDFDLASDLSHAGTTALEAAAKVFAVLERQVEKDEELLKSCRHASTSEKNKPQGANRPPVENR